MFDPLKLQEALSKASQIEEEMQQKLAATVVEGSAGGGAVTVTMNGKKQLLRVHIEPAAVASLGAGGKADIEMLEDLILAAVNEAGRRAEEIIQSSMQGLLGGLRLPGLG